MRSALLLAIVAAGCAQGAFRAGAVAVDITPVRFPVIVNGGFLEKVAKEAHDRLYARALVMESGRVRVAVVVVDSCMMPRDLLDRAKELARERTGIPADRMMISATHTHSAPAAMGCLGTDADSDYAEFLPGRIAAAIEGAARRLTPARAGWTTVDDFEHTHTRRWILRPDKMKTDPFGNVTVRANMHPGYENPDAIAPSGPVDPAISLLSIQTAEGKPLALLANYSMHYFGASPVSSDYYGPFAEAMSRRIAAGDKDFVAMMSQGTSGDQMWMDYGKPKADVTVRSYAEAVADVAFRAYRTIRYERSPDLAMAEAKLTLRRRVPDEARLRWARELLSKTPGAKPRNQPEVYAREQELLHADPVRELKLQALRVGQLGITAIPNEVFAITGLKLKAYSPLQPTFNIELANGAEGYIPPPEQHRLGGYTTWPARTAALETEAEPKIVETLLGLLEKVAARPRTKPVETEDEYARAVLASRPEAYWRLSEFGGDTAADTMGRLNARYHGGIAFYLPGVQSKANLAVHLAGGWLTAPVPASTAYTVELWFWNGLPNHARPVIGHLIAADGNSVALGGEGRLVLADAVGKTIIAPKEWNHVALVHDGDRARVYLNGRLEIDTRAAAGPVRQLHIGSRGDATDTLEGLVDEIAFYRRALTAGELAQRRKVAGL